MLNNLYYPFTLPLLAFIIFSTLFKNPKVNRGSNIASLLCVVAGAVLITLLVINGTWSFSLLAEFNYLQPVNIDFLVFIAVLSLFLYYVSKTAKTHLLRKILAVAALITFFFFSANITTLALIKDKLPGYKTAAKIEKLDSH